MYLLKIFSQNFLHQKIQKTQFFYFLFFLDVVPNFFLWKYQCSMEESMYTQFFGSDS